MKIKLTLILTLMALTISAATTYKGFRYRSQPTWPVMPINPRPTLQVTEESDAFVIEDTDPMSLTEGFLLMSLGGGFETTSSGPPGPGEGGYTNVPPEPGPEFRLYFKGYECAGGANHDMTTNHACGHEHPVNWGVIDADEVGFKYWRTWTNETEMTIGAMLFCLWQNDCTNHSTSWPIGVFSLVSTNGFTNHFEWIMSPHCNGGDIAFGGFGLLPTNYQTEFPGNTSGALGSNHLGTLTNYWGLVVTSAVQKIYIGGGLMTFEWETNITVVIEPIVVGPVYPPWATNSSAHRAWYKIRFWLSRMHEFVWGLPSPIGGGDIPERYPWYYIYNMDAAENPWQKRPGGVETNENLWPPKFSSGQGVLLTNDVVATPLVGWTLSPQFDVEVSTNATRWYRAATNAEPWSCGMWQMQLVDTNAYHQPQRFFRANQQVE